MTWDAERRRRAIASCGLRRVGGVRARRKQTTCPAHQVIIGFSGRTATYIEALVFRCAPLTIGGSAPNYQLSIGNAGDTSAIGGENAGSTFNAINCGSGQVAVSQVPNAGSAIDNFGLRCSPVSLLVD